MNKRVFLTIFCALSCLHATACNTDSATRAGGEIRQDADICAADSLYRAGKYDEARTLALRIQDKAVAESDTTTMIKALCLLTDICIDVGDDAGSVEYYNRCFELSGFGEPMFFLGSSLYSIAGIYYYSGEYDKAMEYAVKSIDIDSRREADAVLALRYLLLSQILYDKGDFNAALEAVDDGLQCAAANNNLNLKGRLQFQETLCRESISGKNPDWPAIEEGYRKAFDTMSAKSSGHHYGAVNPYQAEIAYHLALAMDAQGKDGKEYLMLAADMAARSQKMRGTNPSVAFRACSTLSEIYSREGNTAAAEIFAAKADSLSFIPYLQGMSTRISLSRMEFIRREKDRQIERQKERSAYLSVIVLMLALAAVVLALMLHRQYLLRKTIEQRNSQLFRLDAQKDKLIEMLRSWRGNDSPDLETIAKDVVPLPDVRLSTREKEILEYCCRGMVSKEIAAAMNISVRTVETHKYNIFRKLGVSTTGELISVAFKTGLIRNQ